MTEQEFIDNLLREVSYRSIEGYPNLKNPTHISLLSEILTEWGMGDIKDELIYNLTEAEKDDEFTHTGGGTYVKAGQEDKKGTQKYTKDETGKYSPISDAEYEKRKNKAGELGGEKNNPNAKSKSKPDSSKSVEPDSGEEAEPETGTTLMSPETQERFKKEAEAASADRPAAAQKSEPEIDKEDQNTPEKIKSELDEIQKDLQTRRDSGDAGAGTPVASQGESRFCNTLNTLNYDSFVGENKDEVETRKQEYKDRNEKGGKNKYPNASEWEIIRALGYGDDPTSEEVLEYLAAREAHSKKELERIKQDPNSVFYRKNGFNGNDEAYLEWMRAGFDGAIATKKILEEDTILDTDKPFTTIQSKRDIDDKVESILENKLAKAKEDGNQEDIEFYTAEITSFQKFRKYHDTYVVGQDKNGRTTVVSVSNKKGSDLKDPQNNTTPANRFRVIKDQYGDDVAKLVTQTLDDAIDRVSDTKISAVKRTNRIDIDDSIVAICDTPEMSKYMKSLSSKAAFRKYAEDKGKSVDNMTTREKLELMKEHSQLLLDSGKTPAFEPYGKIATKIGEFTQIAKYKKQYPEIDFDTDSVGKCISIKQDEKDAVTAAHQSVVSDIANADAKQGFPKDGVNGPHTQGYLSTIMDAMHFDTYIDGGDGKMIIQMGIRGAQPQDIRSCLGAQSGYLGDVNTTEGRNGLKKHLREKCRVDAKSGAVTVSDGTGERSICEDTWRTAGTSQKVASGFGEDMRKCIKKSVDSRRKQR
jgi:hypothetical protein